MLVLLFKTIILATKSINKGLTNSIGWNLGRNIRSIHLLDPFTSTPYKGTKKRPTLLSKYYKSKGGMVKK